MIDVNFLEKIKNISGTKDKIKFLKTLIEEDEVYAKIFNFSLDPFATYGIKKIPEFEQSNETDINWDDIFINLFTLSTKNHSNYSLNLCKKILEKSGIYSEIVKKIILKNPDCGINISNFNKSLTENTKNYKIFDYPCCLVSSDVEKVTEKFNWDDGIICQEKCDGMRFNAIVSDDGDVKFYGRSGKQIYIPSEEFSNELISISNLLENKFVFDGELLVKRNGKILDRKTGNGILNKAVRGTISTEESDLINVVLWDIIDKDLFYHQNYEEFSSEDNLYKNRFDKLKKVLLSKKYNRCSIVDSKEVFSISEAYDEFHKKISEGKEGVILKSKDSLWKNTRVTDCVKLKEIKDCDLKVVDWIEGTGKFEGQLGSLVCESSDKKLVVNVGSGFTEDERKNLKKEDLIGKIITLEYNMVINDKTKDTLSLFLPRFVEIRTDKEVANSSKEIL